MFEISEVLERVYLGNTVASYLVALALFVGTFLVLLALQKIVLARLRKLAKSSATSLDDFIIRIFEKTILPVLYVLAFYFAVKQLELNAAVDKAIYAFFIIVVTFQAARFAIAVIMYFSVERHPGEGERPRVASTSILKILKVVVWGLWVVFVLDNLGFDVNAVIAGLGIGGVAVALAAQAILGDLFNSFVIFFDRPFEVGDFLIVDDMLGVVEHIGIKTTRICSLGGEQLIFSNSDLTSSRIRNYKRMARRRVVFKVGVTYQTPVDKMEVIPGQVRQLIAEIPDAVYDRCHFQSFGDFSLNIETVYYVMGSDYNKYMDIQQQINLGIVRLFEREGIEFAYPTQTIHMSK